MPRVQLALIISFVVFSAIAVNAVFAFHYRRVGKPVWKSLLNPFSFPILDFNLREWVQLAMVLLVSMALIVLAAHSG